MLVPVALHSHCRVAHAWPFLLTLPPYRHLYCHPYSHPYCHCLGDASSSRTFLTLSSCTAQVSEV